MATIRPFTPQDVPAVAALRRRVFRVTHHAEPAALERYVHQVFFEGPLHRPDVPSLVSEEGGRVAGFIGIFPRPMRHEGREVMAAVASQLMVAPEHRGVVGVQLLRRALGGPQALLFADVANAPARRLWERVGGCTADLYAFLWTLPLRPARYAAARLGMRPAARAARLALWPLLGMADAVAARATAERTGRARPEGTCAALDDPALLADALPAVAPRGGIHPAYDAPSLSYLLEQARRRWPDETLRGLVVRDADGGTAGWAVYMDGGGGTARVLQVAAAAGREAELLDHLRRHAHAHGAVALQGRLEPSFLPALDAAGCHWHHQGEGMLVYSADPALMACVLRGGALLSGLDGEWTLSF